MKWPSHNNANTPNKQSKDQFKVENKQILRKHKERKEVVNTVKTLFAQVLEAMRHELLAPKLR